MNSTIATPTGRQQLRGEVARWFILGSLAYSARDAADLPRLAPRALVWYRRLLDLGLTVPFHVVLDLGYLLLEGEDFRFRSFFGDAHLDPAERAVRERYETRVLLRRLQEARFPRLRHVLVDNQDVDLAVARALELLLRPASGQLAWRFGIDEIQHLDLAVSAGGCERCREHFEAAAELPGMLLQLTDELARHSTAMDLDRLLQEEDFYELEHVRVFPRESLRLVARLVKSVERHLGPSRRQTAATLRHRALADTNLESVGTYPTGGIAELTTVGPIENLVASELVYLEPGEPIDLFLVRFAENELLKYLRDSAVLRMMRRTVVFLIDDCPEFTFPVAGGELHGTKVIRCLMGLVLALTSDLLRVFRRDDIDVHLRLVAPGRGPAEAVQERREVVDVLHLLFREKEELGTVRIAVGSGTLLDELRTLPRDPQRFRSLIALGRPSAIRSLDGSRLGADSRLTRVAVALRDEVAATDGVALRLAEQPLEALRSAREQILAGVVG